MKAEERDRERQGPDLGTGKEWGRDDLRGRVGEQVGLRHDKNRQGRDVITKDGKRGRNKGNSMG